MKTRRQLMAVLTPRQRQVARLAGKGMPTSEIAERLELSERTVSGHLMHIYQVAGISSERWQPFTGRRQLRSIFASHREHEQDTNA